MPYISRFLDPIAAIAYLAIVLVVVSSMVFAAVILLGDSQTQVEPELPGFHAKTVAEWCQGDKLACDEANFSVETFHGAQVVTFTHSGSSLCPNFGVNRFDVVMLTSWDEKKQGYESLQMGPATFVNICRAQFWHYMGFTCTRQGVECWSDPLVGP